MTKKIRILSILVLFLSCKRVHFDNPLPKNDKILFGFDSVQIGVYALEDSILALDNEVFLNRKYYKPNVEIKDSLLLYKFNGSIYRTLVTFSLEIQRIYNLNIFDSAEIKKRHEFSKFKINKGNIICEETMADTVVNLLSEDKLKIYKGNYYLNRMISKNEWEIILLKINKDKSILVCQTDEKDMDKLKHTLRGTENRIQGSISHIDNAQFNYFVQKGGFRDRHLFKKENSETSPTNK